jgi:hypothetical protein
MTRSEAELIKARLGTIAWKMSVGIATSTPGAEREQAAHRFSQWDDVGVGWERAMRAAKALLTPERGLVPPARHVPPKWEDLAPWFRKEKRA